MLLWTRTYVLDADAAVGRNVAAGSARFVAVVVVVVVAVAAARHYDHTERAVGEEKDQRDEIDDKGLADLTGRVGWEKDDQHVLHDVGSA